MSANVIRPFFMACIVTLLLSFSFSANSDVGPDWMKKEKEQTEQQTGKISKKIFYALVGLSMAVGAISFGWGLVEHYGFIGERKNGVDRMKNSVIGIALALLAGGIIGFAANLLT